MSRHHSHINTARHLLETYKGEIPFAHFLKAFFRTEKKYGSRDRKVISELCYSAFRLGKAGSILNMEDRILSGFFLCHSESSEFLATLKPEWNSRIGLPLPEKFHYLQDSFKPAKIFPWVRDLTTGVDPMPWSLSFLQQPDLFLRIRPGQQDNVFNKIKESGIAFEIVTPACIRLPNSFRAEDYLELNREAVVQDLNSQRTLDSLAAFLPKTKKTLRVWDCCAASGGKSILLADTLGDIDLTVSDTRAGILANLDTRFREARIKKYRKIQADLAQDLPLELNKGFDLILADVPCSGSGTWGRTPEQLVYFDEDKIEEYASLQYKIIKNAVKRLEPGGIFIYITCSVFRKENEEQVEKLQNEIGLQLLSRQTLTGYREKADSMFVAFLKKEN